MISKKNKVRQYLLTSLDDGIFSGAAVGFSKLLPSGEFENVCEYIGHTGSKRETNPVGKDVFFDLASLTKPLVTSLCFFNLISEEVVGWKEKISSLLSQRNVKDKQMISLVQLLTHSSGLSAHKDYSKHLNEIDYQVVKKKIVDSILSNQLEYSPGTKSVYSDLGYILLGHIVERKTGCLLDLFWQDRICNPFNLQDKLFFPKEGELNIRNCAATSYDPLTSLPVCGVVNDDNCRIMGGVAGHAGLFGTLKGVLVICEELLKQYSGLSVGNAYSNDFLRKSLSIKPPHTSWVGGFDTPSSKSSTAGKYFSSKSIGHLGFTGTSFWIDLEKKIVAVVLTNRTFMGTSREKINSFRRTIHDLLMENH